MATSGSRTSVTRGCDDYNDIWSRRVAKEYIEERSQGLYVAGTRVSLASVMIQFRQGASPETILQNFPSLVSLENVCGAVAYYLANQPEVDQYLKAQELKWAEFRNTRRPPAIAGRARRGIRQATARDPVKVRFQADNCSGSVQSGQLEIVRVSGPEHGRVRELRQCAELPVRQSWGAMRCGGEASHRGKFSNVLNHRILLCLACPTRDSGEPAT